MAPQLVHSPTSTTTTETVTLLNSERNGYKAYTNGTSLDSSMVSDHSPKLVLRLHNTISPRPSNTIAAADSKSKTNQPLSLLLSLPFTLISSLYSWRPLLQNGVSTHLLNLYTSLPPITHLKYLDKYLWAYVSFYKAGLDPALPPFLPGYLTSFSTFVYIPLVESVRGRRKNLTALQDELTQATSKDSISNTVFSNPALFGFLSQIFGRGLTYPTWLALFVSSGRARLSTREESSISQIDAEGILLSLLVSFIIPSLKMASVSASQSKWILIWFFYPLTISLVRSVHGKLRRRLQSRTKSDSDANSEEWGYRITMLTYLVGFLHSSIPHLRVLLPRILASSRTELLSILLSPSSPYPLSHPPPTTITRTIYHAIQWDCIATFASSLVASMVMAENVREVVGIGLWNFFGMSLFGTGGALSGLWAWREWRMRRGRTVGKTSA